MFWCIMLPAAAAVRGASTSFVRLRKRRDKRRNSMHKKNAEYFFSLLLPSIHAEVSRWNINLNIKAKLVNCDYLIRREICRRRVVFFLSNLNFISSRNFSRGIPSGCCCCSGVTKSDHWAQPKNELCIARYNPIPTDAASRALKSFVDNRLSRVRATTANASPPQTLNEIRF